MRPLAIVIMCLLLVARAAAEDAPPDLGKLPPAMQPGEPEAVLPGQALIHVRLNKLDSTLDALDGILGATIPEAAVPPQALAAASPPKRMLSLIAMLASQGRAPAIPAIIAMSGLDLQRSITLTLYPRHFPRSWVLSLPMRDPGALGGLVMNALQPIGCETMTTNGKQYWRIQGSNPDLPSEVYLARSADRAYLLSADAGETIFAPATTLAADPVVAALPPGDLAIALCAAPFKPALPMLALQASRFDARQLDVLRQQLVAAIGERGVAMVNARLRAMAGVDGLDQLFEYGECLLEATVSTAVPQIVKRLQGFDGLGVGVALAPGGVSARVDVHAAGIEALARAPLPQPLPMDALACVPFQPLTVAFAGRPQVDAPSPIMDAWTHAVLAKLDAHGLKPGIITALLGYLRDAQHVPTLADAAAWTMSAQGAAGQPVPAQRSLNGWWATALASLGEDTPVTVLPLPGPEPLVAHLTAAAAAANANTAAWNARMQPYLGEGWIIATERFRTESPAGRPMRLVSESSYTTRSGLFGCSEHELINRVIWECQERGGLLALEQTTGERPTALAAAASAPTAVSPGMAALAKLAGPGCDQATLMRLMPALPSLVAMMAAAESSVHNEIDDYLAAARAIVTAHPQVDAGVVRAIAQLPMPQLVESLRLSEQGELRCVLAGHLAYPRPLISGVIKDLLAGPLAHADEDGGLCLTTRAAPGLYSFAAQVDLRACDRLVHDAGNAIATRFLAQPDPARALASAIGAPGDGQPPHGVVLAANPMWSF